MRRGKLLPRVATMDEIVAGGLTYRIANIWVVSSAGQILLQKNNKPHHKNFGKWNASVTGKISAGDTPLSGAQRELAEEIGLKLPPEKFKLLETLFFDYSKNNCELNSVGGVFVDVWVVRDDTPADKFVLQECEVAEVKWFDFDDVKNWREKIEINSSTFDARFAPLLKWFNNGGAK
ncbi:MAG: NUDIX domain-containing protein [Rickettsiales bacterium]|jgi:8-oxo-dGTP pyrophosphatase MutT (NUDIX family)|nr:NUDIX domain-containing protein [Rickettsiales bacterium]